MRCWIRPPVCIKLRTYQAISNYIYIYIYIYIYMAAYSQICTKFDTHWPSVQLIIRKIYTLSRTNCGIYTRCIARQLLLKSTSSLNTFYQSDLTYYPMKGAYKSCTLNAWQQLAVESGCAESCVCFAHVLSAYLYVPSWITAPHDRDTFPCYRYKAWC